MCQVLIIHSEATANITLYMSLTNRQNQTISSTLAHTSPPWCGLRVPRPQALTGSGELPCCMTCNQFVRDVLQLSDLQMLGLAATW